MESAMNVPRAGCSKLDDHPKAAAVQLRRAMEGLPFVAMRLMRGPAKPHQSVMMLGNGRWYLHVGWRYLATLLKRDAVAGAIADLNLIPAGQDCNGALVDWTVDHNRRMRVGSAHTRCAER